MDISQLKLLKYCSHGNQIRTLAEIITELHGEIETLKTELEYSNKLIGLMSDQIDSLSDEEE